MDSVLAALSSSDLCDVHFHDQQKGTIVVTIEGRDVGEEMDKMKEIEKMPMCWELRSCTLTARRAVCSGSKDRGRIKRPCA